MPYFNFNRLINKYSSKFEVITKTAGYYDDYGDFQQEVNETKILTGAIIGFSESKLYRETGTLKAQDKHLYTLSPITNILDGTQIRYNGNIYNIEEEKSKDNAKFTGCYSYVLKWVNQFDEP